MHRHLGHLDIAVPLLEENVERHKTILGQEDSQTFMVMSGLAMTYRDAGRLDKALQVAEQTLELRKRHLGPTHEDTLVSMNNVAVILLQQMQIDRALPLFEETLAGMRKKLTPLHPEILNTTRNLAHLYHAAEQIDRAVRLQEMVTPQYRIVNGADHPLTQSCIDDLIRYYVDVGMCDKATTVLRSIQSSGENRPSTVNPGQAVREQRHRDLIQKIRPTAEKYQHELVAKKVDHADTLAARQAFALALRSQRRNEAAVYHLKIVLDARRRLLGDENLDTQISRLELATTRLQQKRYAEAEPLLLDAYAGLHMHENKVSDASRRASEALQRLVELYEAWENKDKANEWRKKLDERKQK